ncbi:hypothetical protein F3N42_06675 [Marinihelvus fidelis]|uniref:Uncharacterized protein n=1 Tax=Marinihelvus fidelis TaxID=2613842 RepID=A0A5N0TB08_9GAMM|nr:hypothetical protein [Marinihelvus fidelis]KAA9131858.1 hypothetical protein F3N42_06675 [Marinihelvus fidelis]
MTGVGIRYFLYLLSTYFLGEVLILETRLLGPADMYSEWGIVERLHSGMLFLAVIFALISAWRSPTCRELAICLAAMLFMLLLRENDATFELFLPHGVWKYFAAVVAVAVTVYAVPRLKRIMIQANEYVRSAAFGMFATAVIVLAFSRFFGQTTHWKLVMGEQYMRHVKNAAEEGVELLALTLVAMAMLEFLFMSRSMKAVSLTGNQ